MSKIHIFDTGYAWNWLATLNKFIDGLSFGSGFVLILCLFILFVNKFWKSKDSKK